MVYENDVKIERQIFFFFSLEGLWVLFLVVKFTLGHFHICLLAFQHLKISSINMSSSIC